MDILPGILLFIVIIAYVIAKLEIQVEGKDGWASSLPTWQIKNKITRLLFGDQVYTGYHFWLLMTVITFLHFPFFIGYPWRLSTELQLWAGLCIGVVLEDFFWFLLNPFYGLKKFNKTDAHWHNDWWFGLPALYIKLFLLMGLLLFFAYNTI